MGFRPFAGSVHLNRFDPSWVRPRRGLEFWPLLGPSMSWTWVLILGLSTLGIFKFFTLTGSVHFVDWSWPLLGSVHFADFVKVCDPSYGRPLCGLWSWPLVESVHFVDLYKFVTLVGSVHFVDCSLDPWWGLSTLWICISLWPCLGPSTLWTGVLTLGRVRPLMVVIFQ